MKKSLGTPLVAALAAIAVLAPAGKAGTPAQVTAAIQAGLNHLYPLQQANGSFNYQGYLTAGTGASVFALLNSKASWPAAQAAAYSTAVDKGIAYLLSVASTNTVSTRSDGVNVCPSGTGTCTGVYWYGDGETTYSTGIVTGAIDAYGLTKGSNAVATNTGPLAGMTWRQIAQGITNDFAASQSTLANNGTFGYYGGWRYAIPGDGDSDSSTTQWAVYAFIFDEALGATTPASTKTILKHWLTTAQYPAGNGANSGGVCYTPPASPSGCGIGPTVSDTGGWLLAQQWIGTPADDPAVKLAVTWLNSQWKTDGATSGSWLGNFNQPYAMLAVYKGLDSTLGLTDTTGISNLLSPACGGPANPPATTCNWYQDYTQFLVGNQNASGSWAGTQYWTDPLSTAFDISILSGAAIPVNVPLLSVPALSTVGLVILALLLAGFGVMKSRHTNVTQA